MRLKPVIPQPTLDIPALTRGILVIVQFQRDLVGVLEVLEVEPAAAAEVFGARDRREFGVEVEAREEDEDVLVRGVHAVGGFDVVRVPGLPVVGQRGAGAVGFAELVAQADAD